MPKANLESELTAEQVEQLDALLLAGKHSLEDLAKFCSEQGWPSRATSSWTAYKRRAQARAVERSITDGTGFRKQIAALEAGTTDETLKSLLKLQGQIALQLSVNGTADPVQLKMAHKLTQLLLDAEGMKGRAKADELNLAEKRASRELEERRVQLLEAKAAAFDRAQKTLDEAKNSGGITPETLTKIERELKLL